ncbi:response regulator [Geomonas sp. Red875]|uniref:histidine kinase n=2 Tax=Geomesophilobacter sediminis TaxID=2798584 RepID=A0A8J7IWU3_9BACT|nr:response regulator [Geomesophilobacter sediminis]
MDLARQKRKILVIEDDESHAELIRRGFSDCDSSYELTVADSLRTAQSEILSRSYDIVLTDYRLPDGDGRDIIAHAVDRFPVVLMTSHGNEQVAVEAMKSGALDYVVKKPETFDELPRIVERALREWDLMVEHRRAEKALEEQARVLAREVAERQKAQEALEQQTVLLKKEIAERRQAEATLRLSEEKFAKAFDNAPMIMAISSLDDGKIIDVNQVFLRLTNYRKEEVIGRTTVEIGLVTEEMRQRLMELIRQGDHVQGTETAVCLKNGTTLKCEYFIDQINVEGRPHLLTIALDLSERLKLEEQLRHSQKLEALGLLAGGVAHDFNNILTVIGGFCEMLKYSMGGDDPNRYKVEQVAAAADRAANLTRSLLAFGRKGEMQARPADLNDIVRGVEKFLIRIIGEDITLRTDLYHERLDVVVDSGQIEQVLMNLATNARDAMPRGGTLTLTTTLSLSPPLTVSPPHQKPPECFALLTVSDTGHGMTEETRTKIFDPFFTTKDRGKGTGLGLSIVYGIISQHNGLIDVESAPGRGTSFQIYLPISARASARPPVLAEVAPTPCTETILLAEDDPHVQDMMASILTQRGYDVIRASNGQEAVLKFAAHQDRIRLILMDIIMPVMNGKEASERILQINPEVKVLFTSGYTADVIKNRGDLQEGDNLLRKPVKASDLLTRIRETLDRQEPV